MAGTVKNDLRRLISGTDSAINKFIAVNVLVFLVLNLARLGEFILRGQGMLEAALPWIALPPSAQGLLTRPWTPFTYMFVHLDFMHILFNMLWLYWIGKIFEEYLGLKKFSFVYIAGGLSGALFFLCLSSLVPALHTFSPTIGASASVMAVIAATATLLPDYGIGLMFIGTVKLRWLAIGYVVLDIILIPNGNIGGQLSHLGGALFGFLYISSLRRGNDWAAPFVRLFAGGHSRGKLKVAYRAEKTLGQERDPRQGDKSNEQVVNEILDKISKFGYGSLSAKEKQQLFNASQDIDQKNTDL